LVPPRVPEWLDGAADKERQAVRDGSEAGESTFSKLAKGKHGSASANEHGHRTLGKRSWAALTSGLSDAEWKAR